MEQTYLKEGKLLDESGYLTEAGYAFSRVKEFNREKIKKIKRIKRKEWDYYAFLNEDIGFCLTASNLTYSTLVSITYIDFKTNKYLTKTYTTVLPKQKRFLIPNKENNTISIKEKKYKVFIETKDDDILINVEMADFHNHEPLKATINVKKTTHKSIVTTIPFKKDGDFYYNQKANLLLADGTISIDEKEIKLTNALGVLDWGRGVWPYKTTWYWSSCNVYDKNNNKLGFNLGYGLGDTSKGSENVLFYNDEIFKLDDVEFKFTEDSEGNIDYLKEVKVISKNKDIDLSFTPLFNRHDHINLIIISSNQNQVFGRFNGKITSNGKTFEFENAIGFLEKVINRY